MQCIPWGGLCNGYVHCDDQSDEDPEFCRGNISYTDMNILYCSMEMAQRLMSNVSLISIIKENVAK